jgi:PAS domain S-box-containing protein
MQRGWNSSLQGVSEIEMADETGEAGRGPLDEVTDARLSSSVRTSNLDDLERVRAHLAAIVDSSEDGIISKTLEGIVVSWNKGAERLFGYAAQEMIGQSITRVIPPEFQHEEAQILAKIRRGERLERYQAIRIHKEGHRLYISLTISPVRDASGGIVGAAKIAHDITASKQAQQALEEEARALQTLAIDKARLFQGLQRELEARTAAEEALRLSESRLKQVVMERERLLQSERYARSEAERLSHMKDEFLATLSHELRTPLNAIQGWATLLRQRELTGEDRARGLEAIERNVRAQAQIVSDLLDMSRIICGKIHLEVQLISLHEIIHTAIEAVRASADAKKLRIHTLLDSGVGFVRGDPSRLQQILWNLLTNAVKFTPAGGRIQVVLERVNSHVEVVVEDTGIGITADFLPFVFERFRQADAAMTRRHGGLGIGLSIVKTLVELHGGSVRVKSAGANQGTTFVIALPVSHVSEEEVERSQRLPVLADPLEAIELPGLDGASVLIVDDEPDGRQLMVRILEGRSARVTGVASGAEALELLKRQHFDILVSDIGMPGLDGYELMRRARSLDSSRPGPIPAIAVTAYARAEDRQRSLLAGYQMHLAKPIEARELVAGIASLLHLRR